MGRPAEVIAHFIRMSGGNMFNFIRMMAMGDGYWPFGGTPDNPDYTVIDEAALRKMDWVFDYAAARGMNIELILWGYGVAGGEGLLGQRGLTSSCGSTLWLKPLLVNGKTCSCIPSPTNSEPHTQTVKYRLRSHQTWRNGLAAWPIAFARLDSVHHIGSAIRPSGSRIRMRPAWAQDPSAATRHLPSAGPRSFGLCGKAAKVDSNV